MLRPLLLILQMHDVDTASKPFVSADPGYWNVHGTHRLTQH